MINPEWLYFYNFRYDILDLMLRQTAKKCRTCPGIGLTCLLSIPVGSVFLFWCLVQLICDAISFPSYFDEKRIASFDGLSNDVNDLWIYLMVVPTYFICVFLIVEIYISGVIRHMSEVKGILRATVTHVDLFLLQLRLLVRM